MEELCGLSRRIATVLLPLFAAAAGPAPGEQSPTPAPVRPVIEDYFGTKVSDPYRYFENLKDPQVESWFKQQDEYTRGVLHRIHGRDALLARIRELGQSAPARVFDVHRLPGGRHFYEKRLASEDVARLYVRDGLDGAEKLVLDPNKYPSPAGSHNAISYYSPCDDGSWVAVGVSPAGSENAIIHIVNVENGQEAKETIDRARFGGIAWRADNHSFFYNRLQKLGPDQPPTDEELKSRACLHVIGTDADSDVAILGFDLAPAVKLSPMDAPFVMTQPGSPHAIAAIVHGVLNEVTLYEASIDAVTGPAAPWKKLVDVEDQITTSALHGDDLYLLSHKDTGRFKVLRTHLSNPDVDHAEVVVPDGHTVITNIAAAQDGLYVQQLDGGIGRVRRITYDDGQQEELPLPFEGAVGLSDTDPRVAGVVMELSSWTQAASIYSFDPAGGKVIDTKLQPLGKFDRPADLVSEEVRVKGYDGTMVPLSIVHRRDLKMDGSNPTLLDGYGAYSITIDPFFDPRRIAWLERGGVLAEAHVRGGGEYGEDWHKWGQKLTKPNTWRDFIACAQYLVDHKYTSPARLAGEGTSAGGITIGRAFTERPELFAAALDRVGVSNAVRQEFSPNGPPNVPEFGSVDTQEGFEDLYAMDAYLHVRDGVRYPAVLVTTGWNDPRVASWEPGKMAARLQAATASGKPVLLRVEYAAGHGMGSTKSQLEEEMADSWSFLLWQFGVSGFELSRN